MGSSRYCGNKATKIIRSDVDYLISMLDSLSVEELKQLVKEINFKLGEIHE